MDTLDLMRTFLSVVDTDSFTRAGSKLGKSKALVSKHVSELEARLGARLLHRTTRSIGVTEIGRAYYERAQQILADFDNLEDQIRSQSGTPRGLLKLTAPQTLGEMVVMDMVTAFRRKYPAVELDILLADRTVDLVAEGFDVALRVATMTDSSLIARKLCSMRIPLCASPAYLERNGMPRRPEDLVQHHCIVDFEHPLARHLALRAQWRAAGRQGPPRLQRQQRLCRARCPDKLHRHRLLPGLRGRRRRQGRTSCHLVRRHGRERPWRLSGLPAPQPPVGQGPGVPRFYRRLVHAGSALGARVAAANIAPDRQLRYRLRHERSIGQQRAHHRRLGGMAGPARSRPARHPRQDRHRRQDLRPACVRDRVVRTGRRTAGQVRCPPGAGPRGHRALLHGGGCRPARGNELERREGGALRDPNAALPRRSRLGRDRDHPRQPREHGLPHAARPAGDPKRNAGRSGRLIPAIEAVASPLCRAASADRAAPAHPDRGDLVLARAACRTACSARRPSAEVICSTSCRSPGSISTTARVVRAC